MARDYREIFVHHDDRIVQETVYTTTQANGTWAEIGMYSGATATAFSGLLFARALINVTKTSSQTLTVSWRVQVS